VRREETEAAVVAQIFAWYREPGATLRRVAQRLSRAGIPTPTGKPCWNVATVRGILQHPAYTGTAYANRTQPVPARHRKSALLPVGPGQGHRPRPREEWTPIPVPAIVEEEECALVQEKLGHNQQTAPRHNTRYPYLLRALVSCGVCQLSATARASHPGYQYYVCRGRSDPLRRAEGQLCTARYIPARQLDAVVWQDLCAVLTEPEHLAATLARAQAGAWLPQEMQARQATVRKALAQLDQQQQRLLDAYLGEILEVGEFERKRQELDRQRAGLEAQQRQLAALAQQRLELSAVADALETFCAHVRTELTHATFAERRTLVELLIDRVIVTDDEVEIRYAIPTSPEGPHHPFGHLRLDYRAVPAGSQTGAGSGPLVRLGPGDLPAPAGAGAHRGRGPQLPGRHHPHPGPLTEGAGAGSCSRHRSLPHASPPKGGRHRPPADRLLGATPPPDGHRHRPGSRAQPATPSPGRLT
jgi:site-specific DNA recombinase